MPLSDFKRTRSLDELTNGRMGADVPDVPPERETSEGWQIVGDVCERQPLSSPAPQLAAAVSSTAFPTATHRRVSKVRRFPKCMHPVFLLMRLRWLQHSAALVLMLKEIYSWLELGVDMLTRSCPAATMQLKRAI